jgi:hypothetical protein
MSAGPEQPNTYWKPVLTGRLQSLALEAAGAIINDIEALPLEKQRPGFIDGHTGFAMFFEAAARAVKPGLLEKAGFHLESAAVQFAHHPRPPVGLHSGLSGLGWTASRLVRRHPELEVEELCATVDEALEAELQQTPWPHPCDIRDGMAGLVLYAMERLPRPFARKLLERMAVKLDEAAERSEEGCTWAMPRRYWPIYGKDATFPRGLYTMGVAHGIPGALAAAALLHALDIDRARMQALLEGGFRWVASRARSGHPDFPHYLHGTERVTDERFSWCVGNPGITSVLWWTARTWGHPEWQARTLEWATCVAREALERRPGISSNMCCGTAGTVQVFLRLFHATGLPAFEEAAVRWVEHTLALRRPGVGPGGYTYEQDPQRPAANLHFGAAGIALILLAAASSQVPDWDEAFLFLLAPPGPTP